MTSLFIKKIKGKKIQLSEIHSINLMGGKKISLMFEKDFFAFHDAENVSNLCKDTSKIIL